VLSNGLGRSIIIDSIQIGGCTTAFSSSMIGESENTYVVTGCSNGDLKEVFKGDVSIKYTEKRTNLTKTAYGVINSKIE